MSTASEHDVTATFDPPGTCSCCQQQMLVLQNCIRLGHEPSKSKKYIDDIEKSLILEDELWPGMKPIFRISRFQTHHASGNHPECLRPPLQHLHVFRQRRQRPSGSNRAVSQSHHWVVATPFSQSFGSDGMVWGYVNAGCCEDLEWMWR